MKYKTRRARHWQIKITKSQEILARKMYVQFMRVIQNRLRFKANYFELNLTKEQYTLAAAMLGDINRIIQGKNVGKFLERRVGGMSGEQLKEARRLSSALWRYIRGGDSIFGSKAEYNNSFSDITNDELLLAKNMRRDFTILEKGLEINLNGCPPLTKEETTLSTYIYDRLRCLVCIDSEEKINYYLLKLTLTDKQKKLARLLDKDFNEIYRGIDIGKVRTVRLLSDSLTIKQKRLSQLLYKSLLNLKNKKRIKTQNSKYNYGEYWEARRILLTLEKEIRNAKKQTDYAYGS